MALSPRDKCILWAKAGGCCSFPGCRKELIYDRVEENPDVLLGEVAHIVAQSPNGPRGGESPPGGEIDTYENTILLCAEHHTIIDAQPHIYPIAKLLQMKKDHEEWFKMQRSKDRRYENVTNPIEMITETFYSTLLPVIEIPQYVYQAPCEYTEEQVKLLIVESLEDNSIMLPYIVRGGNLITFNRLKDENTPFRKAIDPYAADRKYAPAWWEDPDKYRWFVDLLNRTLNKLTGRKGLRLDKKHRRYYLEPDEKGIEKSVTYTSLSGRQTTRKVAWNPCFKHNNEPKNYWEHLAVGLRFHWVAENSWCLSIRPERRFTIDGFDVLEGTRTGQRSTSRKSRMYNIDVLTEVQFWRDFLLAGQPRIICRFGGPSLIVENTLVEGKINWPPITDDMKKYLQVTYDDDLFSRADLEEASEFEDPDELFENSWEVEEDQGE